MQHLLRTACSAGLLAAAAIAGVASAQTGTDPARNFPDKPIRLIMPNAPGSANDTLARIVAIKMGEILGQQVVIDNRAGAGGVLGMEIGKNANPDGYTLVAASTAAMSIAPHIYKALPYDPVNDYAFLSLFGVTPNLLVVHPSLPVKSARELIDYAKAKQGQLNMASAGPGSQSHLAGVYLQVKAGFESLHIPYKGGGASVASVVANESQWTLTPAPAVMSLVGGGRLRAVAQSLPKRTPLLPDMPAIAETVPGFDYSGWNGLLLPRATPKAIQDKLRAALVKAVESREVKDAFTRQGAEATTNTPQEFRTLVADEIRNIGPVVKAAGLKVE
jgi:tripartite-type tricarboxylate transporter receptor subunit TctC